MLNCYLYYDKANLATLFSFSHRRFHLKFYNFSFLASKFCQWMVKCIVTFVVPQWPPGIKSFNGKWMSRVARKPPVHGDCQKVANSLPPTTEPFSDHIAGCAVHHPSNFNTFIYFYRNLYARSRREEV